MKLIRQAYSLLVVGCLAALRTPFLTLASIATLFVALALVGGGCATSSWMSELLHRSSLEVPVTVYLREGASLSAATDASRSLLPLATVKAITPTEALINLRSSLAELGSALDGIDPSALPAMLEITSSQAEGRANILSQAPQLMNLPGVESVDTAQQVFDRLEAGLRLGRRLGLVLLALVSLVALALTTNTARLAVYARREEIEIMQLVGATPLYIEGPFLIEGALQGMCGGALSVLLLSLGSRRLSAVLSPHLQFHHAVEVSGAAMLVFAGVVLGAFANWLAVQRHLRST